MFTTDTSYMLSGLSCCTGYQFTVSASTGVGQGIPSAVYAFRTAADYLRECLKYWLLNS